MSQSCVRVSLEQLPPGFEAAFWLIQTGGLALGELFDRKDSLFVNVGGVLRQGGWREEDIQLLFGLDEDEVAVMVRDNYTTPLVCFLFRALELFPTTTVRCLLLLWLVEKKDTTLSFKHRCAVKRLQAKLVEPSNK